MDLNTDAGAEAGSAAEAASDTLELTTEQLLDAQKAADGSWNAETGEGQQQTTDGQEGAEKAPDGQEEAKREPLTVEQLTERHENLNKALAAERGEKRQLKNQVAEMTARLEALEKGPSPERQTLAQMDAAIGEWGRVDWPAYAANDPAGYARDRATYEELLGERSRVAAAEKAATEKAQAGTFQQRVTALVTDLEAQEAEFTASQPDYGDAVTFLKEQAARDLNHKGIYDPVQIERAIAEEWLVIGARVKQAGKNAAEHLYAVAKERGYVPKGPDIKALQAGAAAASPMAGVTDRGSNEGGSFEEKVENLSGAALDSYLDKVLRKRG